MRLTLTVAPVIVLLGLSASGASADSVPIAGPFGSSEFNVPITSLKSAKLRTILIQRYDYSCGSAALASLLTYNYHRPHSEDEIFEAMYQVGNQEKIQREGFSLLDMKKYLATLGIAADGYQITLDKLAELELPAITLIETNGYSHFVIIRGIKGNRVLIGDPARGMFAALRSEFEKHWDRVAFLLKVDIREAQATFNSEQDWSVQARAPIGTAFQQQGLGSFALSLPGSAFGSPF